MSKRYTSAFWVLLLFLLFSLVVRIFNSVDLIAADVVTLHPLGPPFSLLFILGEELLLGLGLAGVYYLLWPVKGLRYLWALVITGYMVWLAAEQMGYGLFFGHLDYVLYCESADMKNLSSSIAEFLDPAFFILAAGALVLGGLVISGKVPGVIRGLAVKTSRQPLGVIVGCVFYVGVTYTLGAVQEQHDLHRSFPGAYVRSYIFARVEADELERLLVQVEKEQMANEGRTKEESSGWDAGVADSERGPARKLNVVWYLMESTSYRDTSMFPETEYDTTPFLSRLSKESLFFDNYYTIVAASTRSFFSAITGCYPYMDRNSDLSRYSQIEIPTLPKILNEEGYNTAFFANSDSMFEGLDSFVSNQGYDHYMDKNLVPPDELPEDMKEYWGFDEEIMIDRALDWIASVKDSGEPFYLSYNGVYPHHPFRVPKQHSDLLDKEWGEPKSRFLFRAALAYSDRSVERMYEGLKKLGVLEDTIFIVTPDHGEAFGELHKKNYIHAEYSYEEDSRIFLLMHNPQSLEPRKDSRLGSHMDLMPTLLDMLGIRRELRTDGMSLLSNQAREPVLYHFSRRQLAMRDGSMKVLLPRERGDGKPELYDLSVDPTEQNNLAQERPEQVKKYREMIKRWQAETELAFRKRTTQVGMTPSEMAGVAEDKRKKMFRATQVKLGGLEVCPGAGVTGCGGGQRTFSKGTPITVHTWFTKPASAKIRVSIFGPDKAKVFGANKKAEGRREATFTIPTGDMIPGEKYRMRVSSVYYRAVHDSRWFPFYVK